MRRVWVFVICSSFVPMSYDKKQRTFACTTWTFCPGSRLQNLCIQGQESRPSCTLWEESIHWEVFPIIIINHHHQVDYNPCYPGVVCGGSITLSSIGGYPNGVNHFNHLCFRLSILFIFAVLLLMTRISKVFSDGVTKIMSCCGGWRSRVASRADNTGVMAGVQHCRVA
jgi:hypothetical protein